MAEYQQKFSKLLLSSSSSDSTDTSNAEAGGGDEEFYEKIEAPKFVDFTLPDHYRPDDLYWFCLRVGCDHKHDEEMDSETIYKNFVLRVMAARSPNIKLRRALDRNASRTPVKCPLSAPPKSSKPRLPRMAIISSISEKMMDEKKRVVRPLLKPVSTPVTKTKPVAAKYLTTPRNRKCLTNQNSFRSVQNPEPTNIEVPKSRMVGKALVFHSPKKTIKVKTSVELRTPITKLCAGMNKLEISSQRKRALGYSSKSSKKLNSNPSIKRRAAEPLYSKSCANHEAKSGRSIKSKIKGNLPNSKNLLGNDKIDSSRNNEGEDVKQQLMAKKVVEEFELQELKQEESFVSSMVSQSMNNSDSAPPDGSKGEGTTNREENIGNDEKENGITRFASDSCGEFRDNLNKTNSSEGEGTGQEFMDSDDKENAAASDENRMHNKNMKQNGRKIFGMMHEKSGQVKKEKNLKEGPISSGPVMKFNKPKPTTPKPFRLRTDERGILKEANLERRTDSLVAKSENVNSSNAPGKLQRKLGNDIQKSKGAAAACVTPQSNKHEEAKSTSSLHESNAIQRLEKFKKSRSPLQKHSSLRSKGIDITKKEVTSFLIPGQKLDVIHEASPEVSELNMAKKGTPGTDIELKRRPVTVGREPNFHSTHIPRDCTKKLLK